MKGRGESRPAVDPPRRTGNYPPFKDWDGVLFSRTQKMPNWISKWEYNLGYIFPKYHRTNTNDPVFIMKSPNISFHTKTHISEHPYFNEIWNSSITIHRLRNHVMDPSAHSEQARSGNVNIWYITEAKARQNNCNIF